MSTDGSKRETRSETTFTRRGMVKKTLATAAAAGVAATGLLQGQAKADEPCALTITPVMYPVESFTPEIDISGKWIVITGASSGIGRATGEALHALGAKVIGTSLRAPETVPDPPPYELHQLDIADPASVDSFMKMLRAKAHGHAIDALINNAGRGTWGYVANRDNTDAATRDYHIQQLKLATDTIFTGHVRMTNEILPLMPTSGYARILYTVTGMQYFAGGNAIPDPNNYGAPSGLFFNFLESYNSPKRALGTYVNTLRIEMLALQRNIKVTSVNPMLVKTALMDGLRPVFLDVTDGNGNTGDYLRDVMLDGMRQGMNYALPPSLIGEAYAQLLRMENPPPNVLGGNTSPAGLYPLFDFQLFAENAENAVHYGCD